MQACEVCGWDTSDGARVCASCRAQGAAVHDDATALLSSVLERTRGRTPDGANADADDEARAARTAPRARRASARDQIILREVTPGDDEGGAARPTPATIAASLVRALEGPQDRAAQTAPAATGLPTNTLDESARARRPEPGDADAAPTGDAGARTGDHPTGRFANIPTVPLPPLDDEIAGHGAPTDAAQTPRDGGSASGAVVGAVDEHGTEISGDQASEAADDQDVAPAHDDGAARPTDDEATDAARSDAHAAMPAGGGDADDATSAPSDDADRDAEARGPANGDDAPDGDDVVESDDLGSAEPDAETAADDHAAVAANDSDAPASDDATNHSDAPASDDATNHSDAPASDEVTNDSSVVARGDAAPDDAEAVRDDTVPQTEAPSAPATAATDPSGPAAPQPETAADDAGAWTAVAQVVLLIVGMLCVFQVVVLLVVNRFLAQVGADADRILSAHGKVLTVMLPALVGGAVAALALAAWRALAAPTAGRRAMGLPYPLWAVGGGAVALLAVVLSGTSTTVATAQTTTLWAIVACTVLGAACIIAPRSLADPDADIDDAAAAPRQQPAGTAARSPS